MLRQPEFLPTTKSEMDALGWNVLDILLVTGSAYVDHPSFGTALLGRWLIDNGYRVGIVAQPRWDTTDDVLRMGRPRLFAGVSAGPLDSMLAHYTAFRKKRSDDAYTPGGVAGARPNRAVTVYSGILRQAFKGLPVVVGGVEASLRRASHYDFWTDKLRRSILLDSKADVVSYGMGEHSLLEIAWRIGQSGDGDDFKSVLKGIPGTVFAGNDSDIPAGAEVGALPSHEDIVDDPQLLLKATLLLERQANRNGLWLTQFSGSRKVIFAPPADMLSEDELDRLYSLPFSRRAHPSYNLDIPAVDMIRFSVTSHRGCGGGCSFCSLALHQGRRVRSRSEVSIIGEVVRLTRMPEWRGAISDIGGPSANMWGARCEGPEDCARGSCLTPDICPNFKCDQLAIVDLLGKVKDLDGVKHLRVASGVRYDLALRDAGYTRSLVINFVGGQLKLAPEHICDNVLRMMRKPGVSVFEEFLSVFERESAGVGKEQYIVPYLISAFPGCTDENMRELSGWLRKRGWRPQQVQCFIPTPGTVATAMFYAGCDVEGNNIYVARTDAERLRQHSILLGDVGARGKRKPAGGGWRNRKRRS